MVRVSVFLGFVAVASATDATGASSGLTCPQDGNGDFKSSGCVKDGGDCRWIWLNSNGGICTKCNVDNPAEKLDAAYAMAIGGTFCPAAADTTLDCGVPTASNGCVKDGGDCKFVTYDKGNGFGQMCTKCSAEGEVLTETDTTSVIAGKSVKWCPLLAGETSSTTTLAAVTKKEVPDTERPFVCTDVKVVHDVLDHWMDGCLGLLRQTPKTSAACEEACKKHMACSVWQFSGLDDQEGHCDYGTIETNCRSRVQDEKWGDHIKGGQRIQHGDVEVVSDNKGTKFAMGLYGFGLQAMTDNDVATTVARCKQMCVSDVTCTVWQYFGDSGCWIEIGAETPLQGWDTTNTEKLTDMLGAETIKHTCPKPAVTEDTNWPLIIGLCVAGVLALGAILYMVLKPKPKVKKTRAIKLAQEEQVPLFIPQPTILIPQAPVLVQQAPTYQLVQQPSVIQQTGSMIYR